MTAQPFEAMMEEAKLNRLNLLYISSSKYKDDWHSTFHAHQSCEIFYIISGLGEFYVESAVFPVHADQLVIINSNVEHTEASLPQSPLEYIVMGVDGCDLLFDDNEDPRYCAIDCAVGGSELLHYMQQIQKEMYEKEPYHSQVVRSLLDIFFIKLLRHKSFTLKHASTSKTSIQCAAVKRYLDNHYKESITLDTLASISYLNKFFLAHIFKEEYGISPISYLVQRRIAESRYLLAQTDHRISEIASMLNFSSSSYFTQTFTRIEGISPRDYRKQMQTKQESPQE